MEKNLRGGKYSALLLKGQKIPFEFKEILRVPEGMFLQRLNTVVHKQV
jgi:hypothetical protein